MIKIKTWIKENDHFIEYHDYKWRVNISSGYIEGALELKIYDIDVMNKDMWDYIDQLWSYIAVGIITLSDNKKFETYFPDQPVKLTFTPVMDNVLISVVGCCDVKVIVNRDEFIYTMAKEAIDFFDFRGIKVDGYQQLITIATRK